MVDNECIVDNLVSEASKKKIVIDGVFIIKTF